MLWQKFYFFCLCLPEKAVFFTVYIRCNSLMFVQSLQLSLACEIKLFNKCVFELLII